MDGPRPYHKYRSYRRNMSNLGKWNERNWQGVQPDKRAPQPYFRKKVSQRGEVHYIEVKE